MSFFMTNKKVLFTQKTSVFPPGLLRRGHLLHTLVLSAHTAGPPAPPTVAPIFPTSVCRLICTRQRACNRFLLISELTVFNSVTQKAVWGGGGTSISSSA